MKIIFTEEYKVQDATGHVYKKGETLDCNDKTAAHFINKGVAADVTQKPVGNRSVRPKPESEPDSIVKQEASRAPITAQTTDEAAKEDSTESASDNSKSSGNSKKKKSTLSLTGSGDK